MEQGDEVEIEGSYETDRSDVVYWTDHEQEVEMIESSETDGPGVVHGTYDESSEGESSISLSAEGGERVARLVRPRWRMGALRQLENLHLNVEADPDSEADNERGGPKSPGPDGSSDAEDTGRMDPEDSDFLSEWVESDDEGTESEGGELESPESEGSEGGESESQGPERSSSSGASQSPANSGAPQSPAYTPTPLPRSSQNRGYAQHGGG